MERDWHRPHLAHGPDFFGLRAAAQPPRATRTAIVARPLTVAPRPSVANSRGLSCVLGVALFSIVLVQISALSSGLALKLLPLGVLALACAWALPRSLRLANARTMLLGAYVALIAVTMLRGAHAAVYKSGGATVLLIAAIGLVALLAVALVAGARDEDDRRRRLASIALAPAVYCTTAVLLHFMGFVRSVEQAASGTPAEMLGLLGIAQARSVLPLATGVNSFGIVAVAGLAACALLWRIRVAPRSALLGLAVCSFAGVLLTDTRAALVVGVGLIVGIKGLARLRVAPALPIVLPFSSWLLIATLGAIGSVTALAGLSRHSGDISTGTGRLHIWRPAWEYLQYHAWDPIGSGAYGHVTSGVSNHYAYLFDDAFNSTHNIALQTMLDSGWSGLAVLICLSIVGLRELQRYAAREPGGLALMTVLLVLLLSGVSEAAPSYLFPETLVPFVMVLGAAAVVRCDSGKSAEPDRSDGEVESESDRAVANARCRSQPAASGVVGGSQR